MRASMGLIAALAIVMAPGSAHAVSCLAYLSADRDFKAAVATFRDAAHEAQPESFDGGIQLLSMVEAMLRKGMATELIYANVGMPSDITDKLIEAVNDCGELPASCHFKVALAVAWPFAEYREDTKPAAEALWRAYLEAQGLYIGAYAEPEPGQHRDVAGHDDELVFKLARFEREQCPE